MRLLPECERDWNRIDVEPAPPCSLVTGTVQLAMVYSADWYDELVAYSTTDGAVPNFADFPSGVRQRTWRFA
jgi:hypothetical protein